MDGRGRWMDTVFIERLWRPLKYACVCLDAFETGSELKAGPGRWITYWNTGVRTRAWPDERRSRSIGGTGNQTMGVCRRHERQPGLA
jgi:putative transposase